MPSRRKGEMILFSSEDPKPLVSFLVEKHGLHEILRLLSDQIPGGMSAPQQASKKGSGKKRGRPTGSKNASKKGTKKGSKKVGSSKGRKATSGGQEVGNG